MIARTHNSQTQNAIALFFASALVIIVMFVANYPRSEKLQSDADASVVVKKISFLEIYQMVWWELSLQIAEY